LRKVRLSALTTSDTQSILENKDRNTIIIKIFPDLDMSGCKQNTVRKNIDGSKGVNKRNITSCLSNIKIITSCLSNIKLLWYLQC